MARPPRFNLADVPQHVIQRGNNRQATFFGDDDFQHYLDCLKAAASKHPCAVHAYVLMSNHVHLLMTPRTPGAVPLLMQSLGRRYVRHVNDTHRRTGTLWEGRYRACLVESERYLLACYRYIEMNPVRANLVNNPADYPWSSHRHNALGEGSDIILDHPLYEALGTSASERRAAYRDMFGHPMETGLLKDIRASVNGCRVLGRERFKDEIEAALGRRVRPATRGRPRKRARRGAGTSRQRRRSR